MMHLIIPERLLEMYYISRYYIAYIQIIFHIYVPNNAVSCSLCDAIVLDLAQREELFSCYVYSVVE